MFITIGLSEIDLRLALVLQAGRGGGVRCRGSGCSSCCQPEVMG